jgi:Ca-activated chloride channel family protein
MDWLFPDRWLWPWAFALLLVPLLLLWFRGRLHGGPGFLFSSTAVLERIGRRVRERAGWLRLLFPLAALACLAVALARPQTVETESAAIHSGVDVMLVLDATPTMLAEDFAIDGRRASRVDAVIHLASEFIDARPQDRIGLIYFAAFPSLLSPPTHKHSWLKEALRRVEVRPATAIGDAIASAANRLKDSDAESRVIVLLTDGDNNWGRLMPATAAEAAGALGIRIYAVGIGSDHPVPIPGWGMAEAILDESTLRAVAENSNGRYFRARSAADLREVFREIDRLEKTDFEDNALEIPAEQATPWLVAAAFFLGLGWLGQYGAGGRWR